jgi:hypothetical protein
MDSVVAPAVQPAVQPMYTSPMMAAGLTAQQQQQMLQRQRLQQQQQQGPMPVMLLDPLSPAQQAQLQLMQQQQQQAGLACISPQLMPVQVSRGSWCTACTA